MRYTVVLKNKEVFYTDWYDFENNWTDENYYLVINNISCQYTKNGQDWIDIQDDHL
jgi:hypothetical protein